MKESTLINCIMFFLFLMLFSALSFSFVEWFELPFFNILGFGFLIVGIIFVIVIIAGIIIPTYEEYSFKEDWY